MKIEIPSFLEDDFKELPSLSFCHYIQKEAQHKNEVFIKSNILILVTKGQKILHFKDESLTIDNKNLLFLRSGNYIMSEVLDESYEAMLFLYEDSLLLDFIKKYDITFDDMEDEDISVLKIDSTLELSSLINSTCTYFESNIPNKEEIIKLKLEEAFLNILNSPSSKTFKTLLYSIYTSNYFKIQIERDFSYEENILDLSDKLKITPLAFREKFKEIYNTTPKKWQNIKRLEKAKLLLETTNKNVSEVCIECGFDNLSWFIQVFKKQYNQTPKQIKNNKN